MAKLKTFADLDIKARSFQPNTYFIIDTKSQFDNWFNEYVSLKKEERTNYIFRGMTEAKRPLYTSAQRIWIENDMADWSGRTYISFIAEIIEKAKTHPLLRRVFDAYDYTDSQRDFPLLSILQHYGAPTPLMDWTYNINVALFFGSENVRGGNGTGVIDNYFSIYAINKAQYKNEFLNIRDFDKYHTTKFLDFEDWSDSRNEPNRNSIFYISDFEDGNVHPIRPYDSIKIRTDHPLTSIYNQRIIPQEGLFIFSPLVGKTIDEVFNVKAHSEGSNIVLHPFSCFNIKKDLADYVRRRIKQYQDIDKSFIYPVLHEDAPNILTDTLNSFV